MLSSHLLVQNQESRKETRDKVVKNDGLWLFVVWLRAATNSDMTLGALKNVDESIMKGRWKESLVMWTKKKNVREENDLKKEVEKGGDGDEGGLGRLLLLCLM